MSLSVEDAFGAVLKEIRLEKNLSQMEVVRRSGLDRTTIPRYEKGKLSPTLKNVIVLSEALGIRPDELVSRIYDRLISQK